MPRKHRPTATPSPDDDALAKYRAKRSAGATAEPFGPIAPLPAARQGGLFVVQKHAASHLHYDLRLEIGGVLQSWAVPRGPSLNPQDKRLAMKVEEHPLDYADFEGTIAKGNYGAGSMIVWDQGRWTPIPEPDYPEGLAGGKLLFELEGHKLRGRFALIKTRGKGRSDNEWLLIKKPDAHASKDAPDETSIFTGRSVEDVGLGRSPGDAVRAALAAMQPPPPTRPVRAADVGFMLAESADAPPGDPGWVWEIKYDGYRLFAAREGGQARLYYRRGSEVSARYPEIAAAVAALPYDGLVLDGELIVADEEGRPRFGYLQQRAGLTRPLEVRLGVLRYPARFMVFDLLAFEGHDLRGLPLVARKQLCERLLPRVGPLRFTEHIAERGAEMFAHAGKLGLEGVIGKRADAPYRAGRSGKWLKLKHDKGGEFVVVGWTRPEGSRVGLGALQLAYPSTSAPSGLVFAGGVGTGLDDATLVALRARLEPDARKRPPCEGTEGMLNARGTTWVTPRLVVEIRYADWTADDTIRHAVFVRVRDDKSPADCVDAPPTAPPAPVTSIEADEEPDDAAPDAAADVDDAPAPTTRRARPRVPAPDALALTNVKKVFWPAADGGYTKGDLIAYYRAVAPAILPYLTDRPLVLTRFPDGIHGKSFFQQDAPAHIPTWLETQTMWSSETGKESRYILCNDTSTLLYVANLGSIPLHVWSSRTRSLQAPDWTIVDLDPKGAPFADVVLVARALHELCDELELPCFVKTSGKSGLHVMVPLGAQVTFDQGRELALLLSRVICDELPDKATLVRTIGNRGGRVYLDCYQNGHGKLLVAPLCVRPEPGAPVSTPLTWAEVDDRLDPRAFTIDTVPARLARDLPDPLLAVLDTRPDLLAVLTRLQERLARRATK